MTEHDPDGLRAALPFARRFARALTGSQREGDRLVATSLREGLQPLPPRLAFYAAVASRASLMAKPPDPDHLSGVERALLLLVSLEELSEPEAARAMDMEEDAARAALTSAREKLRRITATDILLIEDEPVIAMDLRLLVQRCGHRVVGVAASEIEALRLARERRPGLILADVNLGRGGDGITAVRRILTEVEVPVIFITAYPERLLTADGVEPAFIINKPFDPLAVAIATYQAITAGRLPIG
jgi:CheY-like chemotaxis protein